MDLNEASEDKRPTEEKPNEVDGKKRVSPLAGLLDHAKYITKSLDNTISTLLKLKEGIEESSGRIQENQESLARSIENLKGKGDSGGACKDPIANSRKASGDSVDDKMGASAEGSRIRKAQASEQAQGNGSSTT